MRLQQPEHNGSIAAARIFQPSLEATPFSSSGSLNVELLSNQDDQPGEQPRNFRPEMALYPYQLRSLGWMLVRESGDPSTPSGGILADAIGFGKTTITLALIDHNRGPETPCCPASLQNLVPSRATLIMVPPNLWHQWSQEIDKFFNDGSLRVIAAKDGAQLAAHSLQEFVDADAVIVSYRIFHGRSYAKLRHRLKHFYWHRIVADEFHELVVAAADGTHPFNEAKHQLCQLQSRTRWGLTSTPPLKTIGEVAVTATFFQIKLDRSLASCAEFVRNMVRKNLAGMQLPAVLQHKVAVLQSVHERALYLQREREVGHASVSLLESASLHRNSPSNGKFKTAEQECENVLKQRRKQVQELESRLDEHSKRIEACLRSCEKLVGKIDRLKKTKELEELARVQGGNWYFIMWSFGAIRKVLSARQALAVGTEKCGDAKKHASAVLTSCSKVASECDIIASGIFLRNVNASDHLDLLQALKQECKAEEVTFWALERHLTQLLLFERSIASVDESFECPICLQGVAAADCCIARCAHVACTSCWKASLQRDPRCPMCRRSLSMQQVHAMGQSCRQSHLEQDGLLQSQSHLDQQGLLQRLGVHMGRDSALETYSRFGSKIRCLIETLQHIRETEQGVKVLVFCQWEVLRITIQEAFQAFDVDHVILQGKETERAAAVKRFGGSGGPGVMLLSMEISPSGLNLTMASHVILVQPTWHGTSHEKSVDFEEQAVGRCWRTGQPNTVHVWRMFCVGTVEADMVDEHMRIWTERQVSSGLSVSSADHPLG